MPGRRYDTIAPIATKSNSINGKGTAEAVNYTIDYKNAIQKFKLYYIIHTVIS